MFITKRSKNNYQEEKALIKLDTNKHFGFCCLFFAFLEIQDLVNKRRIVDYVNLIIESKHSLLYFSRYIFVARFTEFRNYYREVEAELEKCNFNQEQRDFIWKWVRREIDLVAIAESEDN